MHLVRSEGGNKVGSDGGGVERGESSERSLLPRGRSLGGAEGDRVQVRQLQARASVSGRRRQARDASGE